MQRDPCQKLGIELQADPCHKLGIVLQSDPCHKLGIVHFLMGKGWKFIPRTARGLREQVENRTWCAEQEQNGSTGPWEGLGSHPDPGDCGTCPGSGLPALILGFVIQGKAEGWLRMEAGNPCGVPNLFSPLEMGRCQALSSEPISRLIWPR